jgi:glycosyltransferase involved in cell wall biosynthesis
MKVNQVLRGRQLACDNRLGYPVWYSWLPWEHVSYVASRVKPDVIVVLPEQPVRMALAARPTGVPLLVQLMDVEFDAHGGPFEALREIACMANSRFTATKYRDAYGVNPTVIFPFIDPRKYQTSTTRETVTFINPHPQKGVHIALEMACQCAEIPFTFVEAWLLAPDRRRDLLHALQSLPNVTFMPVQKDMRTVYGKCKVLLAPSVWQEAYGRVASEAQMSGIPVIASARGGLPEAVGPGGILVDPNAPITEWVAALRKLWNDPQLYLELSAAARAYATRREMSYEFIFDAMEQALVAVCKSGRG